MKYKVRYIDSIGYVRTEIMTNNEINNKKALYNIRIIEKIPYHY